MAANDDDNRIVTVPELAEALNMSKSHLYHLIGKKLVTEADGLIKYGRKMTRFHLKVARTRFLSGEFGRHE